MVFMDFSFATRFHQLIINKDWANRRDWFEDLVATMKLLTVLQPLWFKRMVEISNLNHFHHDVGRMERVLELGKRLEEDVTAWFES